MRPIRVAAAIAAGLVGLGQGTVADAADVQVDVELVIAADISRSMDYDELKLQRDGYAAAFRHPEVLQAIRSGTLGRIAVTFVEWAGVGFEKQSIPWMIVDGPESADEFATRIENVPIIPASRTSISAGLTFAAAQFDRNGLEGVRRVIDVSGDGPNNQGEPVETVRDRIVAQNITINGLPILLKASTPSGWYDVRNLDKYYEDCVIGGFGAFLIPVTEDVGFAIAVRRKLVLEIAALQPRLMRAQFQIHPSPQAPPADRPKADCLAGERMWMKRWEN
jgi:hypothetical protein